MKKLLTVLCLLLAVCNQFTFGRADNLSEIVFSGSYDKVVISSDGETWYLLRNGRGLFVLDDGVGAYTVRWLKGDRWYQKMIYVRPGQNMVNLDEFTVNNYGVDVDMLRKSIHNCYGNCGYGVIFGNQVFMSDEDINKLLDRSFSHYLIIYASDEDVNKHIDEIRKQTHSQEYKDYVFGIVSKSHWTVKQGAAPSQQDRFYLVAYDRSGKEVCSTSGNDVLDIIRVADQKLKGKDNIWQIDMNTLLLVALAVVVIWLLLKK